MKATKILHQITRFRLKKPADSQLTVIVEIYKVPEANVHLFPEGFKFSMIAFADVNPEHNVLIDCHPPKGPHFHVGAREESFSWAGLDQAYELFWKLVSEEFGELEEVKNENDDF